MSKYFLIGDLIAKEISSSAAYDQIEVHIPFLSCSVPRIVSANLPGRLTV